MDSNKILIKYYDHFLGYELIFSFLIVGLLIFIFKNSQIEPEGLFFLNGIRTGLYTIIASITGSLLGFTITGMAILLVLDSRRLGIFVKSQHYSQIYVIYISTIKFLTITLIFGIIGFLCDKDRNPAVYIFYLNCWGVLISIFRLYRCVWVLKNIIKITISNKEFRK